MLIWIFDRRNKVEDIWFLGEQGCMKGYSWIIRNRKIITIMDFRKEKNLGATNYYYGGGRNTLLW